MSLTSIPEDLGHQIEKVRRTDRRTDGRRLKRTHARQQLAEVGLTPHPSSQEESGSNVKNESLWQLFRDSDQQPYYLHKESGESRWACAQDEAWMEVEDDDSGCVYLEHSVTGDSKWKKADATVWEEVRTWRRRGLFLQRHAR